MARKSLFATLLGVVALAVPSAFADQGGVPHEGSNGQGRPADQTQTTAQGKALAKGHAKSQVKAQGKAKAHTHGKALAKGHSKTQSQTQATAKVNTHAKAGKTTICHATGSATNPYVKITVSSNAVPAHTRHQDGRDIILTDSTQSCPTAEAGGQQQEQQEQGSTQQGTTGQEQAAAAPAGKTGVLGESTSGSSTPSGSTGSSGSPGNGNVLGASTSGSAPSASSSPAATATRSSSSSGLPFTGTNAIIVAILGLALLLAGLTARRIAITNRAR
jgi:hypothetical protein